MSRHFSRLFKDSVVYGLGRYINALASIFLIPLYTRLLPPDQYGVVELFSTLATTLALFAILGLDSAMALCYYDETEQADRVRSASTALVLRLVLALIVSGTGIVLAPRLSTALFGTSAYTLLLCGTLSAFPFLMAQSFSMDYLRLRLQPWRYCTISLGGVLLSTLLSLILVVGLRLGAAGVVIANAVTYVAAGLLGLWLVRDGLGFAFSRPLARKMLRFGIPLAPAALASWVIAFSDRYFMTHYLDLAQVGVYSVGLKLASVMNLATSSFQMAWGPYSFSIKEDPDARQTYAKVLTYFLLATTTLAVILGIFAPELLRVIAARRYAGASHVTGLLVMVPVIVGTYYIVSIGVNLAFKTAYVSMTTGLAAVVSLGLNFLLIPRLGILGAACASLAAQSTSALALAFIAQIYYPIPYHAGKALGILVLGGLAIAAGTSAFANGSPWGEVIKLGVLVGFFASLAVLRIWELRDWQVLFGLVRGLVGRAWPQARVRV